MSKLQTIIKWNDVREVLPDSSREVLVGKVNERGRFIWIALVPYSFKHDAFNANDFDEIAEYALDIDYWAEKPLPIPQEDVQSNG